MRTGHFTLPTNPSQRKRHAASVGRVVNHTSEYIRHRTYIPMGYLKGHTPIRAPFLSEISSPTHTCMP